MTRRAGSADLPLHGGRVPQWLATRMTRLGTVISEAIIHHYGRDELLRRLAHPFWFQSFGAVMGMDWHSSGITTSVIGALKRGLTPLSGELGIHVCGGRGKHSRQTPQRTHGDRRARGARRIGARHRQPAGCQGGQRRRSGRFRPLSAWLHRHGRRSLGRRPAGHERRSAGRRGAITGNRKACKASSTRRTRPSRDRSRARSSISPIAVRMPRAAAQLDLLWALGPDRNRSPSCRAGRRSAKPASAPAGAATLPHLVMPAHHDVRPSDVHAAASAWQRLAAAADRGPVDFAELLLCRVSARGRCARWRWSPKWCMARPSASPIRRASRFAHGGKDRHPFPGAAQGV